MTNKQNILIIHNYYQIPGGEDTVVANEKRLLEVNGHKVTLYSRSNNEIKSLSAIKKIFLPLTAIFNIKTYIEVKRIIKEKSIRIVHVHNTLNLISPSVYYAAFRCKVPVVQTIHNFRILCPGATFYRDGHICEDCVKYGLKCAVKHSCYRGSKLQTLLYVVSSNIYRLLGTYRKINYICLTQFNKEKLIQFRQIASDRVFIKPNFIDISDKINQYGHKINQFVYAGRLDKLKGIDILLEAWKQMGEDAPSLLICGTGPMEEWCNNYIKENSLKKVEMKGFIANDEVKKLIARSMALILPTQWYEGFPMSIIEAFSVGTPVIGSNIGNVGNLIKDGITGYIFQHNSSEELVKSVKKCMHHFIEIPDKEIAAYTAKVNYSELIKIYNKIENKAYN